MCYPSRAVSEQRFNKKNITVTELRQSPNLQVTEFALGAKWLGRSSSEPPHRDLFSCINDLSDILSQGRVKSLKTLAHCQAVQL